MGKYKKIIITPLKWEKNILKKVLKQFNMLEYNIISLDVLRDINKLLEVYNYDRGDFFIGISAGNKKTNVELGDLVIIKKVIYLKNEEYKYFYFKYNQNLIKTSQKIKEATSLYTDTFFYENDEKKYNFNFDIIEMESYKIFNILGEEVTFFRVIVDFGIKKSNFNLYNYKKSIERFYIKGLKILIENLKKGEGYA